jgi:hypothetical protein
MIFGVLAKFQNAALAFFMCVCPSLLVKQLGSHWTDFHEI